MSAEEEEKDKEERGEVEWSTSEPEKTSKGLSTLQEDPDLERELDEEE